MAFRYWTRRTTCSSLPGAASCCARTTPREQTTTPIRSPGIVDINRLIGLNRKGEAFEFAVNVFSDSEFAGATFSPDGDVLFVNIQGNGVPTPGSRMTVAITGPWHRGAL